MSVQPHMLHPHLLAKPVEVLLVGAGGTGSRLLQGLTSLHQALVAKGHPHGLKVTVVAPDRVSPANIGRQAFFPGDVGLYKADILVNRANMALGNVRWKSAPQFVDTSCSINHDLVIGAVDNRSARLGILRAMEKGGGGKRYWLDTGNRADDGQVVLGEVINGARKTDKGLRLPHVAELYPEMIDPNTEGPDQGPSCSLAEALEKQSLFINQAVAIHALQILWSLFTNGQIDSHGAFINLGRSRVTPLMVDPDVWARFGVLRDGIRRKVVRPTTERKKAGRMAA